MTMRKPEESRTICPSPGITKTAIKEQTEFTHKSRLAKTFYFQSLYFLIFNIGTAISTNKTNEIYTSSDLCI